MLLLRRNFYLFFSLLALTLLIFLHTEHAQATRFLQYCSPPGPHVPYAKSLKRSNHALRKSLKKELDPLLRDICASADKLATYKILKTNRTEFVLDGGVHMSLAITSATDTFYTFNYGAEIKLDNSEFSKKLWNHHTIFRIASVSKVFTAWELLNLDIDWDDKVVKYLPELMAGAFAEDWSHLTVGALAGHVGGVTRDFEHDLSQKPAAGFRHTKRSPIYDGNVYTDSSFDKIMGTFGNEDGFLRDVWDYYFKYFDVETAYKWGFPPLDNAERTRCLWNCTREEILDHLANFPLIYPSHTIPAYSNVGFLLLGMVLERKTGLNFEELMKRDLYIPMGLNDTFHQLPLNWKDMPKGWGAFPFWGALRTWNETREIWGGRGVPAGGMYSSAHDISKFLRMIISAFPYCTDLHCHDVKKNSVPAAKVREWLNPTAFTGGNTLLGRPWEIKRKKFPGIHGERAITLYSKAGSGTGYNVGIMVVPELGFGITILLAGDATNTNSTMQTSWEAASIARMLYRNTTLLQIIEKKSYYDAEIDYRGGFVFERMLSHGDIKQEANSPNKNSSTIDSKMRIVMDNGPGLRIISWRSNGTDFVEALSKIMTRMQRGKRVGAVPVARLFPVGWSSSSEKKWGEESSSGEFSEDWRIWLNWEWENIEGKKPLKENHIPEDGDIIESELPIAEKTIKEFEKRPTVMEYQYPKIGNVMDDKKQREKVRGDLYRWFTGFMQAKDDPRDGQTQRAFRHSNKATSKPVEWSEPLWDWRKRPLVYEGARAEYSGDMENNERVAINSKQNRKPLKGSKGRPSKARPSWDDVNRRFNEKGSKNVNHAYDRMRPKWGSGKHYMEEPINEYWDEVIEEGYKSEEEEDEEEEGEEHISLKVKRELNSEAVEFQKFSEDKVEESSPNYLQSKSFFNSQIQDYDGREHRCVTNSEINAMVKRQEGFRRQINNYRGQTEFYRMESIEAEQGGRKDSEQEKAAKVDAAMKDSMRRCRTFPKNVWPSDLSDQFHFSIGKVPEVKQVKQVKTVRPFMEPELIDGSNKSPNKFEGEHWRYSTKQMLRNDNIWPCPDYNGIELHAWNGWSLGHVRFVRKNAGGKVIAIELPALGIRLRKATTMASKVNESKMGKVRSFYYSGDDLSWEYPIWNDEFGWDL